MDILQKQFYFPSKKPNISKNISNIYNEPDLQILLNKYILKNTKIIFYFGVIFGDMPLYILKELPLCKNCKIICIGLWDKSLLDNDITNIYDYFVNNLWDYKNNIIPVKMDYTEAIQYLKKLDIKPDLIIYGTDYKIDNNLYILLNAFTKTIVMGSKILENKNVSIILRNIMKKNNQINLDVYKNAYSLIPSFNAKELNILQLKTKQITEKEQILDQKIAIIVGYHKKFNTKIQLLRFVNHMTDFMDKTKLEYKIFIIKQKNQSHALNLGKLYNSGFEIAENENFDKFIFHDINILPNDDMIPYYIRNSKSPIHLGYHANISTYDIFYLGSIMFNKSKFIDINGYPLNITGWYGWDREILNRMKYEHLKLGQPDGGTFKNNGDKPTLDEKKWEKIKKSSIIQKNVETWKKNGLNNNIYVTKKFENVSDSCVKYSIEIYDVNSYLGRLDDIEQEIEGEVTEKTLRLEIKFSDKEPEPKKEYGHLPDDIELINMYQKSLAKYKDLNNILFPYELVDNTAYDYSKWINKSAKNTNRYNIANNKNQNIDYYKYEIFKNINNDFNHTKKINILHINTINLSKIKDKKIENHEDLFFNTLKLAFNKKNINKKLDYKLILFCKYYNNLDLVTNPNKYKIEGNNTYFNRLATHDDFMNLKKQCNNEKFDFAILNFGAHTNFNWLNNINLLIIITNIYLLYKLYILLNILKYNGNAIISCNNIIYNKYKIDIIYLLKKYFKSLKIIKHKLIANNKITIFIICEKFKGYNNEYNNIFKNVFTEKLYNEIISNKNLDKLYIHEILPDISYRTKYNFINSIVNFNHQYIINKYDYYTILSNIDKLSEKERNNLIKQLYKYKQKLKINYFNSNIKKI